MFCLFLFIFYYIKMQIGRISAPGVLRQHCFLVPNFLSELIIKFSVNDLNVAFV
jgi:hypothetical protein